MLKKHTLLPANVSPRHAATQIGLFPVIQCDKIRLIDSPFNPAAADGKLVNIRVK